MSARMRWVIVAIYAVAMAWVESAVVLYLRTMLHRLEPYQANPMPMIGNFGAVEVTREAATLVMLLIIGALAGTTLRRRLGFTALAFGIWDIFYYVFLKVMCGWPHSLVDWDVLFLIPLPWWGPVLSPMLIAMLMIIWGTLVTQFEKTPPPMQPEIVAWATGIIGAAVALRVFMADAMAALPGGESAVRNVLPKAFNWPLFCLGLALMAAPVAQSLWHVLWPRFRAGEEKPALAENLEIQ